MDNLFGGSFTQTTNFTLRTGLHAVKVVAVNPTEQQWCELAGREETPYKFDYSPSANPFNEGEMQTPIVFWVENEGNLFPLRFNISHQIQTNRDGDKFKYINNKGQISYYIPTPETITENPNMNWYDSAGMRKLYGGEEALFSFMQRLMNYSSKSDDANFLTVCEQIGITPENLQKGDVSGIRKFIDWVYEKDPETTIIVLFTVNQKRNDETGDVKEYQEICSNYNTFFSSDMKNREAVSDWAIDRLKKTHQETAERGAVLTTRLYTFSPQEYSFLDCVNSAEEEVAGTSSDNSEASDLPF